MNTSHRIRFILSLASLALALTSQPAFAGKPSVGAGTPPGVIYYQSASVTLPGSPRQIFSMKADGSQKTPLGINSGLPSNLTHGGSRWFLRTQAIAGQTNLG